MEIFFKDASKDFINFRIFWTAFLSQAEEEARRKEEEERERKRIEEEQKLADLMKAKAIEEARRAEEEAKRIAEEERRREVSNLLCIATWDIFEGAASVVLLYLMDFIVICL